MDDAEVRKHVATLSGSIEQLGPKPAKTVQALLRLYGELLRRVVAAAAASPEVTAALRSDEVIAQMLLLHGVEIAPPPVRETPERCDLCGEQLAEVHAHLLDTSEKSVVCTCAVCTLLFPQRADASGRYRFIPDGAIAIDDFAFDALTWRALEIPVSVAYFVRREEGITAYYPSPAGAVESLLKLEAWEELERENPALRELVPETQALLVNGSGECTEGWIVGIDACYRLVSVMRANWRGLRGGEPARKALDAFFCELRSNSISHRTGDNHAITHAF